MLESLHIRDVALIEDAWLGFGPGLTVLTGETGAGKTVLLSALKLLMGERADSGLVRTGAQEALVEGGFDDDTVASRTITTTGRGRCMLNGSLSTAGALSEALGSRIDLHGQHDHQRLLKPATHVEVLDDWSGSDVASALGRYRVARQEYKAACAHVDDLERAMHRSTEEVEMGRLVLAEIARVDPKPGEDEELSIQLPALEHAETLAQVTRQAAAVVRGDDGLSDALADVIAQLVRIQEYDPAIVEYLGQLQDASIVLDEVGSQLRDYSTAIEHDPNKLDSVLLRLSSLDGLKKRFGPSLEAVLERRDQLERATTVAESGESLVAEASVLRERAKTVLQEAGEELDRCRASSAQGFVEALTEATQDLEMGSVSFDIAFTALPFEDWTDQGPHRIEILYSPSPHSSARPLARIGSGGEISRVMLALKSVLGAADSVDILVFDEIDAGIGGSTAIAVGKRLAELAKSHQVIVVTHLAQVAAFATAHYVVRKMIDRDTVSTVVVPVESDDRVAEIARMLSGDATSTARQHAQELIDMASQSGYGARV